MTPYYSDDAKSLPDPTATDRDAPASPIPPSQTADATRCEDCGEDYEGHGGIIWWTDNALWNEVVGGDANREAQGMLCPNCFMERAGNRGRWRIEPEPWPT